MGVGGSGRYSHQNPRMFQRGGQGPRKDRSLGIIKLTGKKKTSEGDLNPLDPATARLGNVNGRCVFPVDLN